jgi:uncharacterized protein
MMRNPWARVMLVGLACISVTACIRQQQSRPWRLFTLSPLSPSEQTVSVGSPDRVRPTIGVGPVHLPGYLDQDHVVTRISQHRLAFSEEDRWAEPLGDNLARVLGQNLSILLQTHQVTLHPWPGQRRPTHQLEIEVLRFEADTTATAHFVARYILRDVASGQTIAEDEARLTATAADRGTEQPVASLSKALGDFSVMVANMIREVCSGLDCAKAFSAS